MNRVKPELNPGAAEYFRQTKFTSEGFSDLSWSGPRTLLVKYVREEGVNELFVEKKQTWRDVKIVYDEAEQYAPIQVVRNWFV